MKYREACCVCGAVKIGHVWVPEKTAKIIYPDWKKIIKSHGYCSVCYANEIEMNKEGYIYRRFRGFTAKSMLTDFFEFGFINIAVEKAKQYIDYRNNAILLDVRTPSEYEKVHIDGSLLFPLVNLENFIGELNKEDLIIIHWKAGGRSLKASEILVKKGFTNIHNMIGGIDAWQASGFPVLPEQEKTEINIINEDILCTKSSCLSVLGSINTNSIAPIDDNEEDPGGVCVSNSDCGMEEYCSKAIGYCTGTGECQPRPEICITVWDPVCGCDGITYGNDCEAAAAGENVDYRGECQTGTCVSNSDCGTGEYCAKATGDCAGTGECQSMPEHCPDVWDPVCGCDGRTYGNVCEAAAAGMNVDYDGVCQPGICHTTSECGTGCRGRSGTSTARGRRADCQARPCGSAANRASG